PNHTTMVTGVPPARHGVLFNGLLVRDGPQAPPKVEPWRDKAEMVKVPTVYDVAHAAGLKTAQVDWVAIQNPGTITWEFPERPDPQGAIEREYERHLHCLGVWDSPRHPARVNQQSGCRPDDRGLARAQAGQCHGQGVEDGAQPAAGGHQLT